MRKILSGAAIGAGAIIATLSGASAAIVCNREGDCWHTQTRYDYKPSFGLTIHADNWKWRDRDRDRFHWREHDGRGYWRKGVWVTF
jgi:hypothetical protein